MPTEVCVVLFKVMPQSQQNKIVSYEGEIIKIRLKAAPEKGKANQELVRFLSKVLSCAASDIEILSGHTQRLKRVKLPLPLEEVNKRITALLSTQNGS